MAPLCTAVQAEGSTGAAQATSETRNKFTLKTSGGGTYKVAGGEQLNVSRFCCHSDVSAALADTISDAA